MADEGRSDRDSSNEDLTQFGTLRVAEAKPLPEVLDVLIAGGGPAGAAAAVRARELGLRFLVIDYDDLLARIRDYPASKPIKPGYGGGDKIPFPPGGAHLTSLHFDEIDKDDLVKSWRQVFRDKGLAARIGSEFTGLQRSADGEWAVKTWNHRAGAEMVYRAKNVLIAVGAGVPRRFDIPGNTDGIAFRLEHPGKYVGAPALVIGGGTSAAEAVIAISKAKVAAEDPSAVYWSYRGDKLPRVSKALSEEFFDAYVGNGNVRYVRMSEPTAVVTGPDKVEYLSLRIDRKVIEGRPAETVHLEFPKDRVVACIGTDLPIKFLQGIGIKIPSVSNRPSMLVNQHGEVSLPGVFLVGDARGPRYLRCSDFDDSRTYEQITQKRNIKAAMWDAVLAIEAIATRAGIAGAVVAGAAAPPVEAKAASVDDGAAAPAAATPKAAAGNAPKAAADSAPKAAAAQASKTHPAVVPPTPDEPGGSDLATKVLSLLPDGTSEEEFILTKDKVTIGRSEADISSPEDVHMAPHHATLARQGTSYVLTDAGSPSGVWLRISGTEGRAVEKGDLVWVGAQILQVQRADASWTIAHYDGEGNFRSQHSVGEDGLFVGRVSGAPLDPNDHTLSRRHAQFRVVDGALRVFDLGSTNGTFVKITGPVSLVTGDEFRVGSRRFRFESYAPVQKVSPQEIISETPAEPQGGGAAQEAPAPAAEGGPVVTIEHPDHAVSFLAAENTDVLSGFFAYLKERHPDDSIDDYQEKPLEWSCKTGFCGLCAVEIVAGAENLSPVDPGSPELDTLKNKARLDPDPNSFRLACMCKARGPVTFKLP